MKQMKNFKIALAVLAAVSALAMSLSSCSKDNGPYYPVYNGLVTIKTTDSGVTYFQLDKRFFRNLVEAQVAEDHFSFEQVKRCSPKHYSLYSF